MSPVVDAPATLLATVMNTIDDAAAQASAPKATQRKAP